jgi:hypothetical protein
MSDLEMSDLKIKSDIADHQIRNFFELNWGSSPTALAGGSESGRHATKEASDRRLI